jgi:hypothetical protein
MMMRKWILAKLAEYGEVETRLDGRASARVAVSAQAA